MSSQVVFWINAVIGVAIIALFLIRRENRQPSRLKMRGGPSVGFADAKDSTSPSVILDKHRRDYHLMSAETLEAQAVSRREKSLNVLFTYNGHDWDAYEILGLPAGSSSKAVDEAYKKAHASASREARDFLDSAYFAIRSRRDSTAI